MPDSMTPFSVVSFAACAALVTTPSFAQDAGDSWSRFRGPNGRGVADCETAPSALDPETNRLWRTPLPTGHSSPVLHAGSIWLTGADDEDALYTYRIAAADGSITWRKSAPRTRVTKVDQRNNAASPTPAVDDDVVVSFFPDAGLFAYDHDGKPLWEVPLGPFDNVYGMGASPILWRDRVLLPIDQQTKSYLLCVEKATGRELWRTSRPFATSGHCTPIVWNDPELENPRPVLVLPGSFYLDAYDLATGDRVWWVGGLCFEMKSTPVLDDGVIYINGYGSPLNNPGNQVKLPEFASVVAERDANEDGTIDKDEMPPSRGSAFFSFCDLDGDGGLDETEWKYLQDALASKNGMLAVRAAGEDGERTDREGAVLWSYHRSIPQLPSPVLAGGSLYMLNDQGGLLTVLDPRDGSVQHRGRLKAAVDSYYASPVAAAGNVYFVSLGGIVSVLEAGGDLTPRSTTELGETVYATPAIADGRVYVRTTEALHCFGEAR